MKKLLLFSFLAFFSISVCAQSAKEIFYYDEGLAYYYGQDGKPEDKKKAFQCFKKVAKTLPDAQYYVALGYLTGEGTKLDLAKGAKWMTRAADNALPRAVHRMSVLYANGWGVPEDTTKAYEYCLRAAELEDPDAQCDMGLYYVRGEIVEQNYAEAVKWFRLSALQGDMEAQYYLGFAYAVGDGVEQDYAEAVKWFNYAALQGDLNAQAYLGMCYYEGLGVEQDYEKAIQYLNSSAQEDDLAKWKVPNNVSFYGSSWAEIPEDLDFSERTIYGNAAAGCFQNNSSLKSINQPLKGVAWNNAFSGCGALTTISSIELTTGYAMSTMLSGIFSGCKLLTNINFVGSINCNITFPFNTIPLLGGSQPTDATLRSILTACSNANNTNSKTLTLGVVNKTDSTGEWAELVAACNSKGWTVSGLTLQ